MKKRGTIKISLSYLHPHPQNPRKDLGDLTELAESIRKNGILQNLSVVPQDDTYREYTIIIGHRRCAAAKLAGLDEVPCTIIDDMSEQEQFTVMMEENMQRNDLTVAEQAYGFQYMLDLGMTPSEISEKTGFSRTTVNRRLELAKLKKEALERVLDEGGEFQLSLTDLAMLEQIDDVKARNRILTECRGHQDFVWRVKAQVTEQKIAANLKIVEAFISGLGIRKAPKAVDNERYSGKWDTLKSWDLTSDNIASQLSFKGTNNPDARYVQWYHDICIIAPKKKAKVEKSAYELKREEEQRKIAKLQAIGKALGDKCRMTAKAIFDGELTVEGLSEEEITSRAFTLLLSANTYMSTWEAQRDLGAASEADALEQIKARETWKSMLMLMVSRLGWRDAVASYSGEYDQMRADRIARAVIIFQRAGMETTDEEDMYLCGTHELYRRKEADGNDTKG